MEDSTTPWLVAGAVSDAAHPRIWSWAGAVLGIAVVLIGGILGNASHDDRRPGMDTHLTSPVAQSIP